MTMFGLPSFRESDLLTYKFRDKYRNITDRSIMKNKKHGVEFDYDYYRFGHNAEYKVIDNCLIYNHSSVQNEFKNVIEDSIKKLESEDLSNIDTIIIDLRGNWVEILRLTR